MKVINENCSILNFEAWSEGEDTKSRIIEEGLINEFDSLIEELYPDGLTDTHLNDILRFESEWVFDSLGIKDEEEEEVS